MIMKHPTQASPMKTNRFVTFGEVLLRMSTPRHERFSQASSFNIIYGGTECNVAVSLANFGISAEWVGSVPDNDIGRALLNSVRSRSVIVDNVLIRGGRLGLYFLEIGVSVRPSKVVYDREGSAFSQLKPGEIDWDTIFKNKSWFHFSGISAAVSASCADVCAEATEAAKRAGLIVSCDINYRSTLWSRSECRRTMEPLMEGVDVLLGGLEDAYICLGIEPGNSHGASIDYEAGEECLQKLHDRFKFSHIGLTMRAGEYADDNRIAAVYMEKGEIYRGRSIHLQGMTDRIGGGDAFTAGVIFCNMNERSGDWTVNFGVGASALAHTIHGDFNLATEDEIVSLLMENNAGRVKR